MPKPRSKKQDLNERAFSIVQKLTGEAPKADPGAGKKASARKGGLRGGAARAKSLTTEQRTEIAKLAAAARWKKRAI